MDARHRRMTILLAIIIPLGLCPLAGAWWNDYLYGIHDYNDTVRGLLTSGGQARGWVLVLQSLEGYNGGLNAEVVNAANAGLGVVVRMHWGYGAAGSLPNVSHYDVFAASAAAFCRVHQDWCRYYIIANETNLAAEWPAWGEDLDGTLSDPDCVRNRQMITPERYADCFVRTCRAVAEAAPQCRLVLSPAATWAGLFECRPGGHDFDTFDFICYTDRLYQLIPPDMIGGLAFHPKTHRHDVAEITSDELFADGQKVFGCSREVAVHRGFREYRDELERIPPALRRRPIFFTELNPHEPEYGGWNNTNNGYVQAAYDELAAWNAAHSDRQITAMMLYRWDDGMDCWDIWDKPAVHSDLQAAVRSGQRNPGRSAYDDVGCSSPSSIGQAPTGSFPPQP